MVLEKLSASLKNTLQKIASSIFVDDTLINELIKDIQKALLQSDVNVKLVFELTSKIKDRIRKEETPKALTKKEHLINIVYEELVNFLGREGKKIAINKKPFKIMMIGLFGSGKTTTAGKLARYFNKRGYKVALVGLDTYRAAAMEQLEQISKQANVPVFIDRREKHPEKIFSKFKNEINSFDVVIFDTSGRDALSSEMVAELKYINDMLRADENLLVISADIGQAAQKQAEEFTKSCGITSIIVSRMDGTAKGGGALTACAVSKAPIVFLGVGEKINDLEIFNPKGFVGRLLGMGDIEALLEKAEEAVKVEDVQDLSERLMEGKFSLIDLYEQMKIMKNMGSLSKIVDMIPGFSQVKLPKELLNVQEEKLEKWGYAMNSFTKNELENPDSINPQRVERIAKGSGISVKDIRDLLKQYKQGQKLVKMMKGSGDIDKLMKKFKGKIPGLGF